MIYFDIETIPCDDDDLIAEIAESIKPPKSMKIKDTIDKWRKNELQLEIDKAVKKTSLDGLYGRIACVAWADNDDPILATTLDMCEAEAIEYFYASIDVSTTIYCGHNLAGFDLPFLKHRSIILGIKPPSTLLKAMNSKPWDGCIMDTMLIWHSDKSKMVSMKKLCNVLGIEDEDEIDGSMVAETWAEDPQKVINHCIYDVDKARQIYKRLTFNK